MKTIRLSTCFSLGIFFTAALSFSVAAETPQTRLAMVNLDIKAQPLGTALAEFAQQTGVRVFMQSDIGTGVTAPNVSGRLSPDDALEKLLLESGLGYSYVNPRAVEIHRAVPSVINAVSRSEETALGSSFRLAQVDQRQVQSSSPAEKRKSALIDEVVVTARKREERLQDVPISVSAVSDIALERMDIRKIGDLYGRVPSLFFSSISSEMPRAGTRSSPTIRGITRRQTEPAVGIYIDDIYQPNMAFENDFLDLERVEVLRGPQGTLFGRNTLAGAIRLITKRPTNQSEGSFTLEADEFSTFKGKASIGGPLIEGKLAGRLSAQAETTDGYIHNVTRNSDQLDGESANTRLALFLTPSDSFDANFSADYSKGTTGTTFGVPQGCDCYSTDTDLDSTLESENYGFGLTMNWQLPLATITSATGYRWVRQISDYDSDGDGLLVGNRQQFKDVDRFISEELRVASSGAGDFTWVVGAFLFDSLTSRDRRWDIADTTSTPKAATNFAIFEGTLVSFKNEVERNGYAVFAQATYAMLDDRLKLSAGGRYSAETASAKHDQFILVPLLSPLPILTFDFASDDETFSGFTPSGSISYAWNDDFMTYATVSEGFLAGGFQRAPDDPVIAGTPFNDELSTNYEIGAKGTLLDQRMSYGLSLFHIDMKDLQVGVVRVVDGLPIGVVDNAASGQSRGVELETSFRLTANLTLSGALSYTDAKFTDYIDDTGVDRSGERFENVPMWLGAAQIEYVHNWKDDFDITFFGSYKYVDDVTLGTGGFSNPFRTRKAYDVVDASVSLSKQPWKLTLFVGNLLDQYDVAYSSTGAFNLATFEDPVPPRRIGIRVSREW